MSYHAYSDGRTEADRRAFLQALGVAGVGVAGATGLSDLRHAIDGGETATFSGVGQSVATDLAAPIDVDLIDAHSASFASAATDLQHAAARGLPGEEPRSEFQAVATAARPTYDHLVETGFFEATTEQLPSFDPASIRAAVRTFVATNAISDALADVGMASGDGVDLLSGVVANASRLSSHHWVATDEIPREAVEIGEYVPPMTRAAAGGVLLWLEDLDHHLWQKSILFTPEMFEDVIWHARSMAAGFRLMSEGARAIATEGAGHADGRVGAVLATGFSIQAVASALLPQAGYWITEDMRAPRGEGV